MLYNIRRTLFSVRGTFLLHVYTHWLTTASLIHYIVYSLCQGNCSCLIDHLIVDSLYFSLSPSPSPSFSFYPNCFRVNYTHLATTTTTTLTPELSPLSTSQRVVCSYPLYSRLAVSRDITVCNRYTCICVCVYALLNYVIASDTRMLRLLLLR